MHRRASSVQVPVVNVRVMRMAVLQRRVGMLVNMGLGTIPFVVVCVAVMLVVSMRVRM